MARKQQRPQKLVIIEATWSFSRLSSLNSKDHTISGPTSPLSMAQEIATHIGQPLMSVWRVSLFDRDKNYNARLYQHFEKGEGYTGYDLLLVGFAQHFGLVIGRSTTFEAIGIGFPLDASVDVYSTENPYTEELDETVLRALLADACPVIQAYHLQLRDEYRAGKRAAVTNQQL